MSQEREEPVILMPKIKPNYGKEVKSPYNDDMFSFMKVNRRKNNHTQFKVHSSYDRSKDTSPSEFRSASDMRIRTIKPKKNILGATAVANKLRDNSEASKRF